jgi:hypothetical protein
MNRALPIIILLLSLTSSCKNDPLINYPVEPQLEFKDIRILNGFFDILGNPGDAFEIFLDYTDGDANIGMPTPLDPNQYNCITTFYKKSNGVFNLIVEDFYLNPRYFRIPELKEANRTYTNGPVTVKTRSIYDGELQINVFFAGYNNPYNIDDTLKITVQIIDKDDNKSNIAEMEKVYSY